MSTRYNSGSHYENHQLAAGVTRSGGPHRAAAEDHGKQDHQTAHERSRQALEHSQKAFQSTQQAHQATNNHGIAVFGHDDIAALAHELWRARGCPEGSPDEDWFQAAEQLRSRK